MKVNSIYFAFSKSSPFHILFQWDSNISELFMYTVGRIPGVRIVRIPTLILKSATGGPRLFWGLGKIVLVKFVLVGTT